MQTKFDPNEKVYITGTVEDISIYSYTERYRVSIKTANSGELLTFDAKDITKINQENLAQQTIDALQKYGNEENKMKDYKLRMVKEYKELKDKYDKLHAMLVKYDAGKLNFTPTCPIDLLRKQASVMGQYLYILETRAVIENVDLNTEN